MRDSVFFAIAAIGMAGMAVAAIAPGPAYQREAMAAFGDPATGLLVEGDNLNVFQVAEGLSLDAIVLEGERAGARLTAFKPYDLPPHSAGVFLTLPAAFENAFAGRTVRVSIEARRSAVGGSPQFLLRYIGGTGQADDGWRAIDVDDDMTAYETEWTLPPSDGGVDYLGLWPDPAGRGRAIDILRVRAWVDGALPPASLRGADPQTR